VYGPTETTTFASWHLVTEVPQDATGIPIGGPLVRTQLHVLDEKQRPVPIGVRGELYIGGDGVARGYINRPELTHERFLPDSFRPAPPGEPPALLYRTGDMVRRLADGTIEFLGRTDAQVKIRGFRVELAEVEAALLRHDAVAQCVVVAVADEVSKRLVAYLAPKTGAALRTESIRDFARQVLPVYMVPAAFVVLDELPLNINGKVDRSALPRAEAVVAPRPAVLVAPSTELERRIAGAWREVLGPAAIGVDENFFDVGGDSIRMVQLHGLLRDVVSREISIADLFDHPTIRSIADWLGNDSGAAAPPEPHERIRQGQDRLRARLNQSRADRRNER
jgi:aryl carrier-like protein